MERECSRKTAEDFRVWAVAISYCQHSSTYIYVCSNTRVCAHRLPEDRLAKSHRARTEARFKPSLMWLVFRVSTHPGRLVYMWLMSMGTRKGFFFQ